MRFFPLVALMALLGSTGCDLLSEPDDSEYVGTYILQDWNGDAPPTERVEGGDSIFYGVLTLADNDRWRMSFQADRTQPFLIGDAAGTFEVGEGGQGLTVELDHNLAGEAFQATLIDGLLTVTRPSHSSVWRIGTPTIPDRYEP